MSAIQPRTYDISVHRAGEELYPSVGAMISELDQAQVVEGGYRPGNEVASFTMRITDATTDIRGTDEIEFDGKIYTVDSVVQDSTAGRIVVVGSVTGGDRAS